MVTNQAARKRLKTAARVLLFIIAAALALGVVGLLGLGWVLCDAMPHGGCSL